VDKGRGTDQFSLWRRRNPRLAPDPLSGGSREEIARGLRGLTLEYYDGLDWFNSWGDASVKKKVKYTTTAPSQTGFPEAVRITLRLDPNPEKSVEKKEPPLVFQTVVRLELADMPAPSGGTDAADDSTAPGRNAGAPPGQNPGGGMN
jgi:hypothetical protein